jgi:hypothetical protein
MEKLCDKGLFCFFRKYGGKEVPEIAIITQLKDEPIAMLVVGVMFFYKIMETLVKNIIPFPLIFKKKKKSVEELLEEYASERKQSQTDVDERLNKIESSVENLFTVLADHEEFANKITQATLENMLYNESLSMFKRLKSFLRLIAMRVNGRIREKGFGLILKNKETWRDVLEAHIELKIVDQKYFDDVMEDIDKKIFRY